MPHLTKGILFPPDTMDAGSSHFISLLLSFCHYQHFFVDGQALNILDYLS
jgi:hypothetical protein